MKVGDKILVRAIAKSGYGFDNPVIKPESCKDLERCIFRQETEETAGVFLGWNWLKIGCYDPGGGGVGNYDNYEPPGLQREKSIKVAMWLPVGGTRYIKPLACLPEDLTLIE